MDSCICRKVQKVQNNFKHPIRGLQNRTLYVLGGEFYAIYCRVRRASCSKGFSNQYYWIGQKCR